MLIKHCVKYKNKYAKIYTNRKKRQIFACTCNASEKCKKGKFIKFINNTKAKVLVKYTFKTAQAKKKTTNNNAKMKITKNN